MRAIVLRILYVLLAIAIVVGLYYLVIWVLQLLGIMVPEHILRVIFVIIGLMAAIGVISGKFDTWYQ